MSDSALKNMNVNLFFLLILLPQIYFHFWPERHKPENERQNFEGLNDLGWVGGKIDFEDRRTF